MKTKYTHLQEIEEDCWIRLLNGSLRSKDPFHLAALASLDMHGFPALRTVVLRKTWAGEKRLAFHTDTRSRKFMELKVDPRVSLVFYDPGQKIQIRLSGSSVIHTQGPVWEQQWKASRLSSRKCYLTQVAPGTSINESWSGLPRELEQRDPTEEESLPGKQHFAVVCVDCLRMEWLWLHHEGHRRSQFTYAEGQLTGSSWLVP